MTHPPQINPYLVMGKETRHREGKGTIIYVAAAVGKKECLKQHRAVKISNLYPFVLLNYGTAHL